MQTRPAQQARPFLRTRLGRVALLGAGGVLVAAAWANEPIGAVAASVASAGALLWVLAHPSKYRFR